MESGFESLSPSHTPRVPSTARELIALAVGQARATVEAQILKSLAVAVPGRAPQPPSSSATSQHRRLRVRAGQIPRREMRRAKAKEKARMMRVAYLGVYLLPTLAVLALSWFVMRAVSVRIVWREAERRLDDKAA